MSGSETNKKDKRYETYFDVMANWKCIAFGGRMIKINLKLVYSVEIHGQTNNQNEQDD